MNNQPQKQSKQQAAYRKLRAKIMDGTYSPGYRIVIDQIAKEFSTSAIPIREAIRQLEADGLIEFIPYKGAIVTPMNENEYVETLSVLAVLEGYATSRSAMFFPKDKIRSLQEINNEMENSLHDYDFIAFGQYNREFHTLLTSYCDNYYLLENLKQTWHRLDTIRRMGSAFVPNRARRSVEEHQKIISMLTDRASSNEIEQFVREHKLNTVKAFDERKR
jgi:DNA-binding GntR family transcriptional regulator